VCTRSNIRKAEGFGIRLLAPITIMSLNIQNIGAQAQGAVLDSIPPKWKLSTEIISQAKKGRSIDVPRSCGKLTAAQIEITEQTATELLQKISESIYTSVEVTEAFCARAAIAHQLVTPILNLEARE
jgi:amidase